MLSLLFVSTLAHSKELKPTSFRAAYRMEADGDVISSVDSCAVAGPVTIKDTRTEPSPVGERAHEDTPSLTQPITTTGDVIEWVTSGFNEIARHSMLKTGMAGKPEVTVALAKVWIVELVYHNAEYDGRVVLDVSVNAPGGGASCWSDRVDGFAENYGRAGKEVNYQETVNHALDKAIAKAIGTSGFVDALCSCGAPPP